MNRSVSTFLATMLAGIVLLVLLMILISASSDEACALAKPRPGGAAPARNNPAPVVRKPAAPQKLPNASKPNPKTRGGAPVVIVDNDIECE